MGQDWAGFISKAGWLGAAAALPAMLTPYYGIPIFIVSVLMILAGHTVAANNAAAAKASPGPDPVAPDLRVVAAGAIFDLLCTPDRDRLIGLLQSGAIAAWGRTRNFPDIRPIPPNFWINETILFADDSGESVSYLGNDQIRTWRRTPDDPRAARFYDIHFNAAQMRRYFPDRRF